ncbi:hypothetical protein [Terribacillus saccharophilus]|uniref:Uncharacterized protein n=1 Tax=Terribacillus saccharophilus TaxID=361277 RepID=A0ABX4GUP7_9BACI|nr:hypothetical protein [Terribacillus saccharophilus]PAD34273.1 hypothetical protein CHH56_15335 [Terribacillus saccharophilus]PAD94851.1 hypothetical protein CHH50_16425 [Terribacillus saccharophilus]PAD98600.1 hypothetical protein CHH48_16435 [Terribacillus saccharophilus]
MAIHVKRNTGMMGGLAKVAVIVNGQYAAKLGNNEDTTFKSSESVKLKAKQWFFGSKEMEVVDDANLEVRINTVAVLLLLAAIVCLILGVILSPIITALAVILFFVCIIYSSKNWFQLIKVK